MNSSINFHLSNTENIFKTFTIPHGSGYLASRSVLSKNGLGLFHSVAPNIGSNNLQASLIFDIRKKKIVDKDMKLNFLLPADIECEEFKTMEVGGKTIYIDPKRRIASIASARGKNGGMIGGFGRDIPTPNQIEGRKLGAKLGGFGRDILTPNQIEGRKKGGMAGGDRKRRGVTEDMVDGRCHKCGLHGKTRFGQNGKWSTHTKVVDGKPKKCGVYKPSDPTPIPNQTLNLTE